MLTRLTDWLSRSLMVLAAVLAFLLCFLVVADVLGRTVFNSPVQGTPEIISLSIVIVCYLQAAYAIRSGGMLNVEVITALLGDRARSWFAAFASLCGVVFFLAICYGSLEGAAYAWESGEYEGEGALRVPVWPAKFVIVLGTGLAAVGYLLMMFTQIGAAIGGRPAVSHSAQH
ncbi:MAG: TRAP transporter small permease subunit [Quisquiliibacterium sp.]|jgi:TRAP-type C4-dicarboxylate transport system permease small subunit